MAGPAGEVASLRSRFTVKTLLVPLLTHPTVAKVIKYTVYLSLVINFVVYMIDDYQGYIAALPPDAPLSEVLEQFSTSIDMAAWLGLVFLFELETYALPDEAFKVWVTAILKVGRLICYASIGYAAYGYTAETLDFYNISVVDGISNACQLAGQNISMQLNTWAYAVITPDNCNTISSDSVFYRINGEVSVLGESVVMHNRFMGWVDVLNAVTWLIVVFLIEVELWLQAADQFTSRAITNARFVKTFFYIVLIVNGAVYGAGGYPLYAWDAFLWIFGFWAIELNLAEWERDRVQELQTAPAQDAGVP